jgi:acyl carrier protein
MSDGSAGAPVSRQSIVADLVKMIADITQDWDLDFGGGITEETRLVSELGFQSIDVVMLVGEIHKHYGRRNLPFEKLLMVDGRYAEEIRISEMADFLDRQLNGIAGSPASAGGGA